MADVDLALGGSQSIFTNTSTDSVSLHMWSSSQDTAFLEKQGGMQVISGRSVHMSAPSAGYWQLNGAILRSSSKEDVGSDMWTWTGAKVEHVSLAETCGPLAAKSASRRRNKDALHRAAKSTLYKLTLRNHSGQRAQLQIDAQDGDGIQDLGPSMEAGGTYSFFIPVGSSLYVDYAYAGRMASKDMTKSITPSGVMSPLG